MRHYDRASFRHLNDAQRYRDYDYLADDAWIGPNERAPYGLTRADEPPWSTSGPWETRPFAAERAWDEDRGQGREYGRDLGLGYGLDHDSRHEQQRRRDDDYARGYARPHGRGPEREEHMGGPGRLPASAEEARRGRLEREPSFAERSSEIAERGMELVGGVVDTVRHPRRVLEAVRHPIDTAKRAAESFRGLGPKNWRRSDERIYDEVCSLLSEHPDLDASDIEVRVEDGEVTLSGTVEDRRTKYLAEDILDDVVGVDDLHNRLRIRASEVPGRSRILTGSVGSHAGSSTAAVRR